MNPWAWSITAILSLFLANEIVSHFTSSVKEKQKLIESTADKLIKMGIPPEKAAAILESAISSTKTGGLSDITSTIKWALLAYFGIQMLKSTSK